MSRSRKKIGCIKDNGPCHKFYERYANRATRRRNKVRIQKGLDPLHPNQVVDKWSICDYRFVWMGDKKHYDWWKGWRGCKYDEKDFAEYKRLFFKK